MVRRSPSIPFTNSIPADKALGAGNFREELVDIVPEIDAREIGGAIQVVVDEGYRKYPPLAAPKQP